MAGGVQTDKVAAFGHQSRGFESSRLRSKSPLGSLLLTTALLLKFDVHYCFTNKESEYKR